MTQEAWEIAMGMSGYAGSPAQREDQMAARAKFELAARNAGWEYSPAHGGWIHPEEYDVKHGYAVQGTAEEACWLHEIVIK